MTWRGPPVVMVPDRHAAESRHSVRVKFLTMTFPKELREPVFDERWSSGTYLVSGVFFLSGDGITPQQISACIDPLYERLRAQKRRPWPRGLCGYFVVPLFSSATFDPAVVQFVHVRMPHRWAIWPEPVLYASGSNTAERRDDYGLHGAAFYRYISGVMEAGLRLAARMAGQPFPQTVNGREFRVF